MPTYTDEDILIAIRDIWNNYDKKMCIEQIPLLRAGCAQEMFHFRYILPHYFFSSLYCNMKILDGSLGCLGKSSSMWSGHFVHTFHMFDIICTSP